MRSIEEMQASIKNIQSELQQLRGDLDDMRNEKNGGALNFDIDEVAVNAKREPISPHPLSKKDEYTKRQYLTLLLSVAQFEQDKLRESLLFAHKIAYGCGYLTDGNLLDEYTSSHSLTFKQLDEVVSLFSKDDLRLMLIEEMLLMAGKFEKGLKPAVDYISQVCELLNITNEEITFLSQMSSVILSGDLKLYNCKIKNNYVFFDCYLKEFNLEQYRKQIVSNIPETILLKSPSNLQLINNSAIPLENADILKNDNAMVICARYSILADIHDMIEDINVFLYGTYNKDNKKMNHLEKIKKAFIDAHPYIGGIERTGINLVMCGLCLYHLMIEKNINPWKIAIYCLMLDEVSFSSSSRGDRLLKRISHHYPDDPKYGEAIMRFINYIDYVLYDYVKGRNYFKNLNYYDIFEDDIREFIDMAEDNPYAYIEGFNDEDIKLIHRREVLDEMIEHGIPIGILIHPLDSIDAASCFTSSCNSVQILESINEGSFTDFEINRKTINN